MKAKANPRLLYLDEDLGAKVITLKSIRAVAAIVGFVVVKARSTRSTSGGRHWTVEVDRDLTPLQQVAIQACMGSDLKRETLNLSRVIRGRTDNEWNLLYSAKLKVSAKFPKKRKAKSE